MLPNCGSALSLVLLNFGVANFDRFDFFVWGKFCGQTDFASFTVDNSVPSENRDRHHLGDVLVVIDLRFIVCEELAGDFPNRGSAAVVDEGSNQQRLVNVRHARFGVQEAFQFFACQSPALTDIAHRFPHHFGCFDQEKFTPLWLIQHWSKNPRKLRNLQSPVYCRTLLSAMAAGVTDRLWSVEELIDAALNDKTELSESA
jgi:hypothetical protein